MVTMKEFNELEPGEKFVYSIVGWLVIYFFWCRLIFCGNFWSMNDENVLREVQINNPEYVRVVDIDRNWYNYSEAIVETEPDPVTGEAKRRTFTFNSNVIQEVSLVK